jgi:transcriptional regulator with XRE-family HTH domain
MGRVDDARVGRALRVLRTRRGLRQIDVAGRAGISQGAISLIERGHLGSLSVRTVRLAFGAVDARLDCQVLWRGGELDRVLDERHAALGASMTSLLVRDAWATLPEVTFSSYGERGSIDLLATKPAVATALVVELKTQLTSIEETLRRLDVKSRLAPGIVFDRFGWRPAATGTLLVILDVTTARRRVARFDEVLAAALPHRGRAVRQWLRRPDGRLRGLMFLSATNGRSTRPRNRRPVATDRPISPHRSP